MSSSANGVDDPGSQDSRPPRSNSVNLSDLENQASEQFGVTEERAARARERTEEFIDEYPDRAFLPLSREPDESLLDSYVIEEYREEYVEPRNEHENGFTVERLDRATPVTWVEAFFRTLVDRDKYDMGLSGEFEDTETGEQFNAQFTDAWTTEYQVEQQAKMAGAQRQLMGGEYPENEESARSGEIELGEWEQPASVLWAQTGSSMHYGERVPPVDHARRVDTWTDHCYDRVRNLVEIKWGVPSESWGIFRSEDVHGLKDDSQINAGYTHTHPVIFFDCAEADIEADGDDLAEEVETAVLENVVVKHVEECELAEWDAHKDSVEVQLDLGAAGAYAAGYALPGQDVPLMEQSVEYIAWASVMRSAQRQRIARSQLFTEAARADMCKQNPETTHGERLEYDRSGHETELVCSCCGSSVGIGETMTAHRTGGGQAVATDGGMASEEPETVVVGARVGESTSRAEAREQAQKWVENHPGLESVTPSLLGRMGISPEHSDVVEEVIEGVDSSQEAKPIEGPPREQSQTRYELRELRAWNGDSEEPNVGGGPRMVELILPVTRILRETRLQHVGVDQRPKIVVEDGDGRLATYNPKTAAGWLVNHGYREPWHAELAMEFTCHGEPLPTVFDEPEAQPPPEVWHA